MAIVSLKSFDEIINDLTDIIIASSSNLTDFNIGSLNLAYLEAIAYITQYLGTLLEEIESAFYIESATKENLDKRLGDFGVDRILGDKASGQIAFYSFTEPTSSIFIPIGTKCKTQKDDNGIFLEYLTTSSTTLSSTSLPLLGETFPYITYANAQCSVSGEIGNQGSGKIVELEEEINGVSGITNLLAFANGSENESDEAYRNRGRLFLQSLAKGTKNALKASILSLSDVNNVDILDWNDFTNPLDLDIVAPGMIRIILDSENTNTVPLGEEIILGGNTIDKEIQIQVWNLIKDDVRAAGIGVEFRQTSLISINIDMDVILEPDSDSGKVATLSQSNFNTIFYNRILTYFSTLNVNEDIRWSKVASFADSINGVIGVENVKVYKSTDTPVLYSNVVLSNNSKGILGTITINGNVI